MKKSMNRKLGAKYRILIIGIIVFSVGVAMYAISGYFLSAMSLCKNSNVSIFVPNTVVAATCPVISDIGQDLTFRAVFYGPTGAAAEETIKIPAHVQITDPNGKVLYDRNFEDKTIISFRPETHGEYTATVKSLEDPNNRIHRGDTMIVYALGFLTSYSDVNNPLGNSFNVMIALGNVTFLVGIGIIIYGVFKAARGRKNEIPR